MNHMCCAWRGTRPPLARRATRISTEAVPPNRPSRGKQRCAWRRTRPPLTRLPLTRPPLARRAASSVARGEGRVRRLPGYRLPGRLSLSRKRAVRHGNIGRGRLCQSFVTRQAALRAARDAPAARSTACAPWPGLSRKRPCGRPIGFVIRFRLFRECLQNYFTIPDFRFRAFCKKCEISSAQILFSQNCTNTSFQKP